MQGIVPLPLGVCADLGNFEGNSRDFVAQIFSVFPVVVKISSPKKPNFWYNIRQMFVVQEYVPRLEVLLHTSV